MPIYVYRCAECGFQKDYLQKMSDPVLTECPECHKSTFSKQLTAPKVKFVGNGWYETDFKGGSKPAESKPKEAESKPSESSTPEKSSSTESTASTEKAASAHSCGTGGCSSCS